MRRLKYPVLLAPLALLVGLGAPGPAAVARRDADLTARLTGFQETPSISTRARGRFEARIDRDAIEYVLSYENLEAPVSAAHIHFAEQHVAGGVIAFLCGSEGTPACPSPSGTVSGTITASDVIGPEAQGIAPGEFREVVRALRAGVTYANVHSTTFPAGEIRGQIRGADGPTDPHDDDAE
jgi:hypothetical protein